MAAMTTMTGGTRTIRATRTGHATVVTRVARAMIARAAAIVCLARAAIAK